MKETAMTTTKSGPAALLLSLSLLAMPAFLSAGEHLVKDALSVPLPRSYQRAVLALDPIEMALASGTWKAPKAGDAVAFPGAAAAAWEKVAAGADGWFSGPAFRDGYVYVLYKSDKAAPAILNGLGNVHAFVNGEPRMGGKYAVKETYESWEPRFDYGQVPILLKKGDNHLLFRCTRGRLKVVLSEPSGPVLFNEKDVTLPDAIAGEPCELWGAIVVMNATGRAVRDLVISATGEGLEETATPVGVLQPFSVRKAAFLLRGPRFVEPSKNPVRLTLKAKTLKGEAAFAAAMVTLECKSLWQNHKRTFRSAVDGSIQYYAVNPAQNRDPDFKPALVLSVHGASVEATNQAGSYESKTWAHIVAPTNRRPYGFDWEDWGRLDALEAMADFVRRYPVDPDRVYLTGHSMGGHGAWILGTQFPGLFAAVGPSAGWISFRTYASRQKEEGPAEVEKMTSRALLQGDTLALTRNLTNRGVYILHGDKDDSVPVDQARQMAKALGEFHKDFIYHEEKDAGHWWDKSDEPGVDCVDWPPLFDFFARHALPRNKAVREVEFASTNPGLSAECHWARIEAQVEPLKISAVRLRFDPGVKRFSGTTENVARLVLDTSLLEQGAAVTLDIDGQKWTANSRPGGLWLYKKDSAWTSGEAASPLLKGPRRNGPFKDVFRNRMVFVYGTQGTAEENAWAFGKARFDAEIFQYQGNGAVEVVSDSDFRATAEPDRNVILYGNATTNRAWKALLGAGPVQCERGRITVGTKQLAGRNLACLFLRPRPDSDVACVGAVSGTGIQGMRLTNTRPYLAAGYALPDLVVFDSDVGKGSGRGVKLAGFFGVDWSFDSGDFVWN